MTDFSLLCQLVILYGREAGYNVSLTEYGQESLELARSQALDNPHMMGSTYLTPENNRLCVRFPLDEWYSLSSSGTYTMTLVWNNPFGEPSNIPSNPVTFTRLS